MYWRSVSKELPKEEGWYLVTAENCVTKELELQMTYYSNNISEYAINSDETVFKNGFAFGHQDYNGEIDDLENVFAWMPVELYDPDAPKMMRPHWAGDCCSKCGRSKYDYFTVVSAESKPFGTWRFCPNCGEKLEDE